MRKQGYYSFCTFQKGLSKAFLWISLGRFPKVQEYKSIFMVLDLFSKYVVFMPAPHEYLAKKAAKLLFNSMVKHFKMPKDIVSDKDSWLISRFQVELFKLLRTIMKFSTTNHPHTNRQIERVNAMLKEYLRHYMIAKNYLELMNIVQLCYNQHKSSTTMLSRFKIAIRYQPHIPLDVLARIQLGKSISPITYKFAKTQQKFLRKQEKSLEKASRHIKKYTNKETRLLEFQVGEIKLC